MFAQLKIWWREFLLLIGFIALLLGWGYIEPVLESYNAKAPTYFYIITEILWDITAAMTAWHFLRGKGWLNIKTIKSVSSLSTEEFNKHAWNWFRLNRLVALVQPGITAVLVFFTDMPAAVKLMVGAYLAVDMFHTLLVIRRSKAWQNRN